MDFNQIQELVKLVSKSKLSEFILKEGDFKLVIRSNGGSTHHEVSTAPAQIVVPAAPTFLPVAAPVPAPAPASEPAPAAEKPAAAPAPAAASSKLIAIKSPMVGTFYRAPSPEKPPFVQVGDEVTIGKKICVIEAMKLFNEIESEVKGRVVQVLVEDKTPVVYDQPLFMVEPI